MSGHAVAQAFKPYIGNTVAIRIGQADFRRVGEVQPQAVGGAEPGAFADQHHHHACAQQFANFIGHGNSPLLYQNHRRQRPAFSRRVLFHARQEGQGVAMHGQCRQAIRYHHGDIDAAGVGRCVVAQLLRRVVVELASQIRALQVAVAVSRGTVQQQALAPALG